MNEIFLAWKCVTCNWRHLLFHAEIRLCNILRLYEISPTSILACTLLNPYWSSCTVLCQSSQTSQSDNRLIRPGDRIRWFQLIVCCAKPFHSPMLYILYLYGEYYLHNQVILFRKCIDWLSDLCCTLLLYLKGFQLKQDILLLIYALPFHSFMLKH